MLQAGITLEGNFVKRTAITKAKTALTSMARASISSRNRILALSPAYFPRMVPMDMPLCLIEVNRAPKS